MHGMGIKCKNMNCVFNQFMTKNKINIFVWLDNVYDLAVSGL